MTPNVISNNNNRLPEQEDDEIYMKAEANPAAGELGEEPSSTVRSPQADKGSSIKSQLADCWGCMANFCIRTYECMYDACCSAWDWSAEHMCCCCRDEDHRPMRHKRRQAAAKGSKLGTTKSPLVASKTVASKDSLEDQAQAAKTTSSPSTPPHQQQTVKVAPVPVSGEAIVRSTTLTTTNEALTTSTKEPPALHEPQPQAPPPPQALPSPPSPNQPQIHLAKTQPQPAQLASQQPAPTPEPPRISFETTGSIFGDRKRSHASPNLLQLENGRFRSPGLSKTIMGPNGRMIRVSFVSGFPSIKSIESRGSLTTVMSKVYAKKSTESTKPHENPKHEDDMGLRKVKSVKSYKSIGSKDGNEM